MTIYENVGQRITVERKKLGLSRERLAELVGVSAYYIGQIERGSRKMSFDTLVRISDCFHVPIDYLVHGEQPDCSDNELQSLLKRCSSQELALITDMLKAALPHLRLMGRDTRE